MKRTGSQMRFRSPWAGLVLVVGLALIAPSGLRGQGQQAPADAGKRVFETICIACHTIGGGVRIGPDLQGVTERRSHEWLARFIRNPEQVRAAGDSIAVANMARFSVRMPYLGLSDQQVESVIAHLGGTPTASTARPPLFVPTLALAVLAAVVITLIALTFGAKRVEIRA